MIAAMGWNPGDLIAEYFGGPKDGKREPIQGVRHCEAPDCDVVDVPAWMALTPPDGFERDEAGEWRPTAVVGTYWRRHPESVDGAYQYAWHEGTDPPSQRSG
jgi:hypothetical protein